MFANITLNATVFTSPMLLNHQHIISEHPVYHQPVADVAVSIGIIDNPAVVSPVTLSGDWSRVARLLLLASLSAIGSVGNVFLISAVMIDDYLRKRGNAFVVNVALADFLVSGLLVPISAVVILAGLRDNVSICRFQWFLAALCFLVTIISLTAIASESYARLCCATNTYDFLTPSRITIFLLILWILCAATSGLQFTNHLTFDYCTRKHKGLIPYQATVGITFVFIPVTLTIVLYAKTKYHVYVLRSRGTFRPPLSFSWDYSLMLTNLLSFILFILFWLPFGVVLGISIFKYISDRLFYNLAWFAISKSCINSILYCMVNRHFRSAYINLFHYCCCKTTVSFSRRQRPEGIRPPGDVRVHIIPGYNMYCSPQRAGRDGGYHHHYHHQTKRCSNRLNGNRDVYEL